MLNSMEYVCPITGEYITEKPRVILQLVRNGVWGEHFRFSGNGEVLLLDASGIFEMLGSGANKLTQYGLECPMTGEKVSGNPRLRVRLYSVGMLDFYFSKAGEEQLLIEAGLENVKLIKRLFF